MRRSGVRFPSWAPVAARICWPSVQAGEPNIEHLLNIRGKDEVQTNRFGGYRHIARLHNYLDAHTAIGIDC